MAAELVIAGQAIEPGRQATLELALPNLYTHTQLTMPLRVVRGRRDGPCLLVSAALHGDEINGVEIIRRLLAMPLLRRVRGTLIAVPVVNVMGFLGHSRYLPDRRDLNRSFPGSDKGSLASRLASLFVEALLSKATHGIDLHTGAIHRTNLPQIRAHLEMAETRAMAEAFRAPVILESGKLVEGSLRREALERGIPYLVYEGGEALRFDELAIRAGVRGVVAVMRELGMLPALRAHRMPPQPVIARQSLWMRAPQSGIVRAAQPLGAWIGQDEPLAWIGDPFGDSDAPVPSRVAGIVIGRSNLPLVHEGEALF
ncbi:MAG: succinylglutamate desuccinylase/aspartoacylase family protein, partial [Candidatus Competibacterales bacterium]|nr:succinylglutamate desuccinylase/aspartoacylase family protein [Candidatus Competibacterales bacterium]